MSLAASPTTIVELSPIAREVDFRPLLVSIREAQRQLGGIGKTALYGAIKRYDIRLVRLGGRSMVPAAELDRVVAELMASDAPCKAEDKAKALAAKSVAARRFRSGVAA